jgi:alpha-glucosidase (family GH31 glycosyl hydrolase)
VVLTVRKPLWKYQAEALANYTQQLLGNSDEELCNRWMQLSAFFPFYRNHNVLSANSQEAYVWASVAEASKTAMAIRYSLLPYLYTLFYQAHTSGSTVMRALSWEFTTDPTLAAVDNQFLLGPSIMVSYLKYNSRCQTKVVTISALCDIS